MKFKVCGMKYNDNIREVASLAPDLMGFIFYEGSKRYVGENFHMPEIPKQIKRVGVFMLGVGYFNNPAYDGIEIVMKQVNKHNLNLVQLHGDEVPEFCEDLSKKVKIIKAFGMYDEFDLSILAKYEPYCEYFLFDTKSIERGGSGKQFDWEILKDYKGTTPFFLSGGISLEDIDKIKKMNLKNMIGIDVNSKFEISPALKDINKLKLLKNEI